MPLQPHDLTIKALEPPMHESKSHFTDRDQMKEHPALR